MTSMMIQRIDDDVNFISYILGEDDDTIATSIFPRQATLEVATSNTVNCKVSNNINALISEICDALYAREQYQPA
jgi:hypothetical protein